MSITLLIKESWALRIGSQLFGEPWVVQHKLVTLVIVYGGISIICAASVALFIAWLKRVHHIDDLFIKGFGREVLNKKKEVVKRKPFAHWGPGGLWFWQYNANMTTEEWKEKLPYLSHLFDSDLISVVKHQWVFKVSFTVLQPLVIVRRSQLHKQYWLEDIAVKKPWTATIGVSEFGVVFSCDVTQDGNFFFGGPMGSGKTTGAITALVSLLDNNPSATATIIAGKGMEAYRNVIAKYGPRITFFNVLKEKEKIAAALDIEQTRNAVEAIFDENDKARVDHVKDRGGSLRVLVWDEAHAYFSTKDCVDDADKALNERMIAAARRIMRLGRAAGYCTIISSQGARVDELQVNFRSAAWLFFGRTDTPDLSNSIFGNKIAYSDRLKQGVLALRGSPSFLVRIARVKEFSQKSGMRVGVQSPEENCSEGILGRGPDSVQTENGQIGEVVSDGPSKRRESPASPPPPNRQMIFAEMRKKRSV